MGTIKQVITLRQMNPLSETYWVLEYLIISTIWAKIMDNGQV
jgi:hypothetical protein